MSELISVNDCLRCHGKGFIKSDSRPYEKHVCSTCGGKGIITPILGRPQTPEEKAAIAVSERTEEAIDDLQEEIEEKESEIEDLEDEISVLESKLRELRGQRIR